jgi:hypothetical protein
MRSELEGYQLLTDNVANLAEHLLPSPDTRTEAKVLRGP